VTAPLVALFGGVFGFIVSVVGIVLLVVGKDQRIMWDSALGLVLFFLGITVVGRAVELMGVSL
jgi:hypothetical protein